MHNVPFKGANALVFYMGKIVDFVVNVTLNILTNFYQSK